MSESFTNKPKVEPKLVITNKESDNAGEKPKRKAKAKKKKKT